MKHRSNHNFYRKTIPGFTLIELLVVISIIALLMAILMPSLNKARRQARVITCSGNIKQMIIGMNVYASENNGKCPERPDIVFPSKIWNTGDDKDVLNMFDQYIIAGAKTSDITFCPFIDKRSWLRPRLNGVPNTMTDDEAEKYAQYLYVKWTGCNFGYSLFTGLTAPGLNWEYSGNRNLKHTFLSTNSTDVVLADFVQVRLDLWFSSHAPAGGQLPQVWDSRPTPLVSPNPKAPKGFGGLNVGFGDGHVENRRETKNSIVDRTNSSVEWYVY
ncbi:PilD-dependent protein PddA [Limihaloglobus sulfuriphilus]|uniref:PilD-dependent protein PddA n=1 Tax=Limihaloglobus sulfuriphilus TaxID=1851148 RepID=A0A1Q2MCR4_9BACT|nr:prepilin-type N-terminal cleavage/methylation domain-containing protein [Limihaloglobus sulfuriphilus]AQQ70496.1 PilD-dependent protein PddA [Limihaloglobus sulfuriphilus]